MEFSNYGKDTVDPRTMSTTQPAPNTFSGNDLVSSPTALEYQSPYPPPSQATSLPPNATSTIQPDSTASAPNGQNSMPPPPRRSGNTALPPATSQSNASTRSSIDTPRMHTAPIVGHDAFMEAAKKEWKWHLEGRRLRRQGSSDSTSRAPVSEAGDVGSGSRHPFGSRTSSSDASLALSISPGSPDLAVGQCATTSSAGDGSPSATSNVAGRSKRSKPVLRLDLKGTEFTVPSEGGGERVI